MLLIDRITKMDPQTFGNLDIKQDNLKECYNKYLTLYNEVTVYLVENCMPVKNLGLKKKTTFFGKLEDIE